MKHFKIAKKLLHTRFTYEMSLQFNIEKSIRFLDSQFYESFIYSIKDEINQDSDVDDVQVIACYAETRYFPPQLVAGRAMTSDLTQSLSNLSLPETETNLPENYFTEPSQELVGWFVGNPPPTFAEQHERNHPIAHCGQIDPVSYLPFSPPLADQRPTDESTDGRYHEPTENQWTNNPHITGLGIGTNGI